MSQGNGNSATALPRPRSAAVFNGEDAVGVDVKKAKGFSTTQVAKAVRDQVQQIQGTLPEGVAFRVVRDAGTRVAASVANVEEALTEGTPEEAAGAVFMLCSDDANYITGQTLICGGGIGSLA